MFETSDLDGDYWVSIEKYKSNEHLKEHQVEGLGYGFYFFRVEVSCSRFSSNPLEMSNCNNDSKFIFLKSIKYI